MNGCMICTSLSIAPAFHIARHAQFVDLDGPLWLKETMPKAHAWKAENCVLPRPHCGAANLPRVRYDRRHAAMTERHRGLFCIITKQCTAHGRILLLLGAPPVTCSRRTTTAPQHRLYMNSHSNTAVAAAGANNSQQMAFNLHPAPGLPPGRSRCSPESALPTLTLPRWGSFICAISRCFRPSCRWAP